MPKRDRKRHTKRYIIIMASLAILAFLVFSSINQKNKSKPSCSEYLKIQHTKSIATTYTDDNRTIIIKTLGINITAIGGDAHNIIIDVGSQEPEIIQKIPNGTTSDYQIDKISLLAELDADKGIYLIPIEVQCDEAEPASIIIEAQPHDILITRQQITP